MAETPDYGVKSKQREPQRCAVTGRKLQRFMYFTVQIGTGDIYYRVWVLAAEEHARRAAEIQAAIEAAEKATEKSAGRAKEVMSNG